MSPLRPANLRDALDVALRRGADPLVRAQALVELRSQLEELESEIVGAARGHWLEYTWGEIAEALGRRKQTTWGKHHKRHP